MLKCKELAEQSSDYLDANLAFSKRLSLAFHLLICGKCRAFVQHLSKSIAYFNALPEPRMDEASAKAIAKKAISQQEPS